MMAMVGPAAHDDTLTITVLGTVSAFRGGEEIRLQRNLRQVLAVLVAAGATGISIDRLADDLWPGDLPSQWQAAVRVAVSRLRKRLGLPLQARNGRYRLEVATEQVDAWQLVEFDRSSPGWDPAAVGYLGTPHVFPGVEPSPLVRAAAEACTAAQHSLIAKLAADPAARSIPTHLLVSLAEHAAQHLGDEQLAEAVATIYAGNGHRDQALDLIDRSLASRAARGQPRSARLEQRRADLTDGHLDAGRPADGTPGRTDPGRAAPPTAADSGSFDEDRRPGAGHPVPEHIVPEHTVPEHTVPEHTVPEHPVPEHTVPEHPVPEHTVVEHPVLEHPVPEHPSFGHAALERLRVPHFVGRSQELDVLQAAVDPAHPGGVVVRGPAACGKSALLAEFMHRAAAAGAHVVRIIGSSGQPVGLGPFSSALPAFRAALVDDDSWPDTLTRKGLLSAKLLHLLQHQAANRHLVVVVDDAHFLDSMSCDLVEYLAYSAGDGQLSLVIGARPAKTENRWAQLERALDRMPSMIDQTLGPLTDEELGHLVTAKRPTASFASRAQIVRWLSQTSQGWPGVAATLLDGDVTDGPAAIDPLRTDPDAGPRPGADQPTGLGPAGEGDAYDRLLIPLDEPQLHVGRAAAVLGSPFLISELAALVEMEESALVPILDGLVRRELLVETETLGRFEFCHQLIADAFERSTIRYQRARLHVRAAQLSTTVHDLARHLVEAGTLTDPVQARATMLASAREHLADGAFWESINAFRTALSLGPDELDELDELDAEAMVDYATALSLAGLRARSTQVRARAYQLAIAEGRWDLALDAAISGLPEAEVSDGEADRLHQLDTIPPDRLDRPRQLSQAVNAARQGALSGDFALASRWVEQAEGLAKGAEEQAEAALTRHFVDAPTTGPAQRLTALTSATEGLILSARSRCRLAQLAAIDHFSVGCLSQAHRSWQELTALADETNDPLRQWHALIFGSLLHETEGRWVESDAMADQALAHGRRHGITQADILRLAQSYFRLRFTGDLALLATGVDDIPEPDGDSLLFASAKATILDAAGRTDDAATQTLTIADTVLRHPSASGLACLAIISSLVGRYGGPRIRAEARVALEPFRGSALVIGAGLGSLGPVDSLLEGLDPPAGEPRQRDLTRAVRLADQLGLLTWRVRSRLDLATVTRARKPLDEARELAQGTSLAALVDRATAQTSPV